MPYAMQFPDLGAMIQGGARYAQSMRDQEAFALQKEDRAYARDMAQKKLDFETKVRGAAAKVLQATPETRDAAMNALAVISPDAAVGLQTHLQKQQAFQTDQTAAATKNEAGQFTLQNKKQLDAATMVKQSLETFKANPSYETMQREINRMKMAQGLGVPIDPQVIAGFESTASAPDSPQFAQFHDTINRAANETIERLGPKPKATPEFRPGASTLDQVRVFSSLLAKEKGATIPGLLTSAQGPEMARMADPDMWTRAGDIVAKEKASTAAKVSAIGQVPGVIPTTSSDLGKLQADTVEWTSIGKTSARLHDVAANRPDLFGDEARLKQAMYSQRARKSGLLKNWTGVDIDLSEKDSKWLADRRDLITSGINNLYTFIVMKSGKAVTEPERALLVEAFGDVKEMSAGEYAGIMTAVNRMAIEEQQLRRSFMKGFDTRTKEAQAYYDAERQKIVDRLMDKDITVEQAVKSTSKLTKRFSLMFPTEPGNTDIRGVGGNVGSGEASSVDERASANVKAPTTTTRGPPRTVGGVTKYWDGKKWVE